MTLDRSFKLPELQFSHPTNGDITTQKKLKALREIMSVLCKLCTNKVFCFCADLSVVNTESI